MAGALEAGLRRTPEPTEHLQRRPSGGSYTHTHYPSSESRGVGNKIYDVSGRWISPGSIPVSREIYTDALPFNIFVVHFKSDSGSSMA